MLVALVLALAALFVALRGPGRRDALDQEGTGAAPLAGARMPSLAGAAGWVSAPVPADSLQGRLAAIVFWSSTQPRSTHVLHAAAAWHDAYARYGLRVVGVHVPEFAFAADSAHVASAARRAGARFPIALDPALRVWSAFGGEKDRPRVVLAGPDGRVIADEEGTDALARLEREIRSLLEAMDGSLRFPATPAADTAEPGGEPELHPPVHLGRARVEGGPLSEVTPGRPTLFAAQLRAQVEGAPYIAYPVGRWILGGDGLTSARGGAQSYVALRYDAGPLGAVLGPPESGPGRVWVLLDDRWIPRDALGDDVRLDGRGASYVWVDEPRLYALCRPSDRGHVVKLSPEEPGVTVYAFTFEPEARSGMARP